MPNWLGAVGDATPATHFHTAWGQWAVQLLQCIGSLPGGIGHPKSCNALPPWSSGQWNSCNAVLLCLGAVGVAIPTMHCHTAWGRWAVELLQRSSSLPGSSGHPKFCHPPPHFVGAVGIRTPLTHFLTAWWQCAYEVLQCTASLPWGRWAVEILKPTVALLVASRQCNACNALPHGLWAVGSG